MYYGSHHHNIASILLAWNVFGGGFEFIKASYQLKFWSDTARHLCVASHAAIKCSKIERCVDRNVATLFAQDTFQFLIYTWKMWRKVKVGAILINITCLLLLWRLEISTEGINDPFIIYFTFQSLEFSRGFFPNVDDDLWVYVNPRYPTKLQTTSPRKESRRGESRNWPEYFQVMTSMLPCRQRSSSYKTCVGK